MLQAWLVVSTSEKKITVLTVLFHKDVGEAVAVTNYVLHFFMFFPTKSNVKLAYENTRYFQFC